jgi:hypothetical protein
LSERDSRFCKGYPLVRSVPNIKAYITDGRPDVPSQSVS